MRTQTYVSVIAFKAAPVLVLVNHHDHVIQAIT
jgi:hypothetical protein